MQPQSQKPASKKKFWLLVTLIPLGLIVLLFLIATLVITTYQSSSSDTSSVSMRPSTTTGFMSNGYADGTNELTVSSTDGFTRNLLGASSDYSLFVTFKHSGAHGMRPSALEVRRAADGTVARTIEGLESCSIVTPEDTVFCSMQDASGASRSLVELSISSGEVSGQRTALTAITDDMTTPEGDAIASFYTNTVDYLGTAGDKNVFVVTQWRSLGTPEYAFAVLLNKDNSLGWSTHIEGANVGSSYALVNDGKGVISHASGESQGITVIDLESKATEFFEDVAPMMASVTLTNDGWVIDSSQVGSTGISINDDTTSEDMVEAFDLNGKSIKKAPRLHMIKPSSNLFSRSRIVYQSAESLLDTSDYTAPLIVDGEGNVVAQHIFGNAGKDRFEAAVSGKRHDGYIRMVSLDGKTVLTNPDDSDGAQSSLVELSTGRSIKDIKLEGDLARIEIAAGILYSDNGYGEDQKMTIYLPKAS